MEQTLPRDCYEILIVDNDSKDDTASVIKEFVNEPGVRSIFEPVTGLSKARNTGWREARGNYLGYIDDDATAEERWLEDALWCFENVKPSPAWVGGPIHLDWETEAPAWINEELSVPLGKVYWGEKACWLTPQQRLGGGNSFYVKEILKETGGFDENLGRKPGGLLSGEEAELQQRFQAMGRNLYYHPGIGIWHFVSSERCRPEWFYRRYYWGGISDSIMFKALKKQNIPWIYQENTDSESRSTESRLKRIISNALRSIGIITSKNEAVRARIYMSYVLGRISGTVGNIRNRKIE
jgi:glycosyltransferase involved in cell wall biosynthesis